MKKCTLKPHLMTTTVFYQICNICIIIISIWNVPTAIFVYIDFFLCNTSHFGPRKLFSYKMSSWFFKFCSYFISCVLKIDSSISLNGDFLFLQWNHHVSTPDILPRFKSADSELADVGLGWVFYFLIMNSMQFHEKMWSVTVCLAITPVFGDTQTLVLWSRAHL